eukprot:gb/GECG01016159.1/.p1 GENE.gb/GECG01016159.1/~~gb/GECG01016159.1/.p1  ORF type:complete len:464 (+),score=76.18 gb/GECG01016159.1/:1-1392(+)
MAQQQQQLGKNEQRQGPDGPVVSRSSALEQYERIGTIGKGSFGTVVKIRRKQDNRTLVWKELNYGHMSEKEKQLVVSEVNILRELRHPFVVRYYDRIIDKAATQLYIVMEYCEGGDLGRIIKKCKRDGTLLEEDFVWKVFTQIVYALKECHRRRENGKYRPILHRDLKPGNIFLDTQQNVKIGDFGLAKELASQSKYAYTNVGTPFYMSPEMINEMRYNEKSDIWALGCLLYEMCALAPPFEAQNHLSLAVKINSGKFNRIPTRYSDDLHRAIRWMLQREQEKRPAVEELERLPHLKKWGREASLLVREHQVSHSYAMRYKELKQREEEVRKREQAVAEKEKQLQEREEAVRERESQLQQRLHGGGVQNQNHVVPDRYSGALKRFNSESERTAYPNGFSEATAPPPPQHAEGFDGNQSPADTNMTHDKENQLASHFQNNKVPEQSAWAQQGNLPSMQIPSTGM